MQNHSDHYQQNFALLDWVPLLVVFAVALTYFAAVAILRKKNGNWNKWRAVSFLIGMLMLGAALLPSLMRWAHTDLKGHMVQHLLIGMYAPLFLVLGAPITLILVSLPVKAARGFTALLRSPISAFLSHPVTAFALNIGGMFALYLTPLYMAMHTKPYLHFLAHVHFLAAGYLFTWSMIGPDPAPKRPGHSVRVGVLFISIAAHAFLSKFMYAHLYPINSIHSSEEIREASKLMYYWGDLAELLLLIALFTLWYQKRSSNKLGLGLKTGIG